ncbi:uncharacterized protein LOC126897949 [Daktulosphaira vitifoliae]|uniref:uncharacterized protein LOC126897949 n=1 Tax=Daktulosphaira vitifoliae TaxID=58002 RepID=UPI0021AAE989|nr:uncharacterized protein LOC126897949 [Daktulosphaira vitifoliae]
MDETIYDFIYGIAEDFWKSAMDEISQRISKYESVHFVVDCNLAAISRLLYAAHPDIDPGDSENLSFYTNPPVQSHKVTYTIPYSNNFEKINTTKQTKKYKTKICKDIKTPKITKPKVFRSKPLDLVDVKNDTKQIPAKINKLDIDKSNSVAKYRLNEIGDLKLL